MHAYLCYVFTIGRCGHLRQKPLIKLKKNIVQCSPINLFKKSSKSVRHVKMSLESYLIYIVKVDGVE